METKLEELDQRISKLEKHNTEEVLTLIEMLSNLTFFGNLKKTNCEYARDGQCSFFILKRNAKNSIPIVSICRIRNCPDPSGHYHIDLSNITCSLCQHVSGKEISQAFLKTDTCSDLTSSGDCDQE